jgi:mono/diheme cytochrome c family protein
MSPSDPAAVPPGEDSVQAMHRPHQDVMNDPVMLSADGTPAGIPGQDSVSRMLDVLMREQAEPRDGFEPVPFWVAIVCGALLMWGGYYIGANTADFRRDVFDRSDLTGVTGPAGAARPDGPDPDPQTVAELMKVGAVKYQYVCQSCHKDGNGDPAQGVPPLNGSEWVVGAEASPARLSRILLFGLHQPITVKGRQFNGQMPAQGVAMRDYEIAGVITFVRNSWDNKGDPDNAKPAVTASVVKAAREKEKARRANGTQPVTADELRALPVDYADPGATPTPPPKKDGDAKDKK